MRTALLVIDVQESFRHRDYWQDAEVPAFIANVQALIDRCAGADIPVLQVFHEEPGGATHPFAAASGHVRTMRELRIEPDAVFRKSVHSAMFARGVSAGMKT